MAINEASFDTEALQRACGAIRPGADAAETNGGICKPLRVHVRPGQYLYRFACSSRPPAARMQGCWWVEYEVMCKIVRFVREQHGSPSHAARYFLALPWSWTEVDRLVRARLVARIDAYRGEGKPARGSHVRDAGTRYIPPQHIHELYQLFIPGMDNAAMASHAFTDVRDDDIRHAPIFR